MPRTTPTKVKELLDRNYDARRGPSLVVHIATSHAIINQVVTCATRKSVTITSEVLELMERWLAGYYYTKVDPLYGSRSTEGASGSFLQSPDDYKNVAIDLDPSGCLRGILMGPGAAMEWMGKPVSEQIDYDDRN